MPLTYTMLVRLPQEPLTLKATLHHLPCLNKIKGDLVQLSLVPLPFHKDGTLISFFLLQCAHYKGKTFKMFHVIIAQKKKKVKSTVTLLIFLTFKNCVDFNSLENSFC